VSAEDVTGFRGLILWQRAQAFALRVTQETGKLPRSGGTGVMGSQLLRAAGSVPANIAEGYGRFSQGAYRNHLSIARGSLFESESWIDLMFKAGYLSSDVNTELTRQCHELTKLLTERMRALSKAVEHRVSEAEEDYDVC
jgi:four helix bundle protein